MLGVWRKRHQHIQDSALLECVRWLEMLAIKADLEALGDPPTTRHEIPSSGPVVFTLRFAPLATLRKIPSALSNILFPDCLSFLQE